MRGKEAQVDDVVVERTNAQALVELPPLELLREAARGTDAELAAIIFEDGRRRHKAGAEVSLSDYIKALPELPQREVALDAAIGVCLGRYHATPEERSRRAAIERQQHPELASAIDLALCLDQLMGSPDRSQSLHTPDPNAPHPTELGPLLEDGKSRYLIRGIVGQGASSTVYEAEDRLLSETTHSNRVAIKLFHRENIDPELFERTLAEARKARSIQHPGVIRVLDVGKEGTSAYIVQEHVPSESLDTWLAGRGKDADNRTIVKLIRDVASALGAIHAAGIWHRDLKPANVLVTEAGQIKIVDFGSSRNQQASETELQSHGGTLAFMAPEQFNMEQSADSPAADIFSLGAMLFWIFVGKSPHGVSRVDALASLSEGTPKDELEEALSRSGIGSQLSRIILRALSHQPAQRYSSADSLVADLESWLAFKPIEWQKPNALRRLHLLLQRRPVTIGLTLLFVILAGAGAYGWIHAIRAEEMARESKFAADIAQAKVEAKEKWSEEAKQKLLDNFSKFPEMVNDGVKEEVLMSLWMYEWSHSPAIFDSPVMAGMVWKERTSVVEDIQSRLLSKYQSDTVSSQLLSQPLAMWQIHDGNYAKAEKLLADSEAYWTSKAVPATDPWIQDIRKLSAAAKLLRRLDELKLNPPSDGRTIRQHLEPEITSVKSFVNQSKIEFDQGPITKLLNKALAAAMAAN